MTPQSPQSFIAATECKKVGFVGGWRAGFCGSTFRGCAVTAIGKFCCAADAYVSSSGLSSKPCIRGRIALFINVFGERRTRRKGFRASVMLIVRHGGPLSSVHDHRDGTIYFRPPNEATLIYTPTKRQIEICADSPAVRQQISGAFAEVVLNHDALQKPLTWKRYDLSGSARP